MEQHLLLQKAKIALYHILPNYAKLRNHLCFVSVLIEKYPIVHIWVKANIDWVFPTISLTVIMFIIGIHIRHVQHWYILNRFLEKRTLDFRICTALTNQNFFLKFVSTSYHGFNHFSLQRAMLIHVSKWGPCTVDNNTWQADIEVTRCGLGRRYSTTYWSTLLEFSSQCTGMECIFLTIYNQWYHSVLPFNLSVITKLSRLVMLNYFKQKYIFAFLSFPKFEVAQIIKILLSRSREFLPV